MKFKSGDGGATYITLEALSYSQPCREIEACLGPCELPRDGPQGLDTPCRIPLSWPAVIVYVMFCYVMRCQSEKCESA